MLAGLGLLAGPFLLGAREEKVQEQVVDTFYQDVKKAETETAGCQRNRNPGASGSLLSGGKSLQ